MNFLKPKGGGVDSAAQGPNPDSPSLLSDDSFDPDFEDMVVRAFLRDPLFFQKYRTVVFPEMFNTGGNRLLVSTLSAYFDESGNPPSPPVVADLLKRSGHRDSGAALSLVQRALDGEEVEETDQTYIKDRMISWAKWREIDRVCLRGEGMDPKQFAAEIDTASRVGDNLMMKHTLLNEDDGEELVLARERVKTPWGWLNDRLGGGPQKQDLCVVLTVINGGKTTALVDIASRAVLEGKFVVYFTFEDGELKIKRRLMQALLGMTVEEMMEDTRYARRKRNLIVKKSGGRCDVKDLINRQSQVSDVVSFVKSVEELAGRKVDVVITDYADRFKPPSKRGEIRHELRETMEECKGAARSLDVVHWTARQVNKTRVGKDLIGAEHAGEAWGTMESPDLVIGFGQTLADEKLGRIVLYTSKVRDAKKHEKKSLLVQFDRQRIFSSSEGESAYAPIN